LLLLCALTLVACAWLVLRRSGIGLARPPRRARDAADAPLSARWLADQCALLAARSPTWPALIAALDAVDDDAVRGLLMRVRVAYPEDTPAALAAIRHACDAVLEQNGQATIVDALEEAIRALPAMPIGRW
jgi:hypothetical protein